MEVLTKDLLFGDDCRDSLVEGIKKLSSAVKSTLGPYGRTVLIETVHQTHGLTVTKDGVTVARSIELSNPVENMAVRIVKEAAEKTATLAGDGTSTAIVLSEALILEAIEKITPELNRTNVLKYMADISEEVINTLKKDVITCTDKILLDVATISANNDHEIGKIIADAYKSVGNDGIITIEKGYDSETRSDIINGLKVSRGYSSPLFINDWGKEECIMENVSIIVCDTEITNFLQIEEVLKVIIPERKKLLIINTLSANVRDGRISACIVSPPNFGFKQHELMQDIALSVGATYFSEKTGDNLSMINFESLGFAKKVIVSSNKTVILEGGGNKELLDARVSQLRIAHDLADKKINKDFINERIASLIGGIGIIYVGGNTDMEQKELFDRVEDAVLAVKSAIEEGIISGAGKALWEIDLKTVRDNNEQTVAETIIMNAIKVPLMQILKNADLDAMSIYGSSMPKGEGYNLKTGKYGNLIEMGVIDPFKVTRVALQNAISVAITILSTNASINIQRA
jgi:chaperonin GroEL